MGPGSFSGFGGFTASGAPGDVDEEGTGPLDPSKGIVVEPEE